jgi:hypothetical protein
MQAPIDTWPRVIAGLMAISFDVDFDLSLDFDLNLDFDLGRDLGLGRLYALRQAARRKTTKTCWWSV